jgi:hypothetical protein
MHEIFVAATNALAYGIKKVLYEVSGTKTDSLISGFGFSKKNIQLHQFRLNLGLCHKTFYNCNSFFVSIS